MVDHVENDVNCFLLWPVGCSGELVAGSGGFVNVVTVLLLFLKLMLSLMVS